MQKQIKIFARFATLALAAVLLLASFTGCGMFGAADKDFASNGMTITLTEDFSEGSTIGKTVVFQSADVIVTVLKETFTDLGTSAKSAKEYAEIICKANGLTESTVTEKEGYADFTYEKNGETNGCYYYARTYKSADAYWLIQFGCLTEQKEAKSELFYKWADTVRFDG